MLLAHAIAIAEARSYIAALDDHAHTVLGAFCYDQALIYLDSTLGEILPATIGVQIDSPDVLYRLAVQAVADLADFGVDPLHIELTLAYLVDAHLTDNPSPTGSADPGELA